MSKSKVPPELLELLKFENNSRLYFAKSAETTGMFKLIPKEDTLSNFHFLVTEKAKTQTSGRPIQYLTTVEPADRSGTRISNAYLTAVEIKNRLNEWLTFIEEYQKSETILDDLTLQRYQEDFENKFKILDPDAEVSPFDLEKQIYIAGYLDWVVQTVEKHVTEENKQELELIKSDSISLKNEVTKVTKNQTIKRLSKIWARAQKNGLELIKEIFINVSAEVITKLITGGTK